LFKIFKIKEFIKSLFSDIDNMASSKRMILLWTGIPIWDFTQKETSKVDRYVGQL